MWISFFHNVTLIISFMCVANALEKYVLSKTSNGRIRNLITSLLASLLAILTMMETFTYQGMRFDLRSVPILLISFTLGWKYGLISGIFPSLYRWSLGGNGVWTGIVMGILLPIVLGPLWNVFQTPKSSSTSYQIINIKQVIISNLILSAIKAVQFWFYLGLPYIEWLYINIYLVFFSSIALFAMVYILNYSHRKLEAERELIERKERYQRLVALIPDGLSILHNGKYMFANKPLANLLGVEDPKELIGKSESDFSRIHPDDEEALQERVKKILDKEESVPFLEQKIIRHDGLVFDAEIATTPFIEKDKKYILAIIRDISEQKKAELHRKLLQETLELDQLKTEFFSNISHELKTPLNIILGTTQLLKTMDCNCEHCNQSEALRKYIKMMQQNCYRLLRLINNVIDSTRSGTGYFKMKVENYDIVNVVENIVLSVAEYVEDKGVQLVFDTDVEEKIIACDADKIERVMLNLLSNAVKFTESGGSICVTMYDHGERIVISVKDTGMGIPEDMLNKIFERFRQVDSATHRKHEGSGIGLSLVQSIIDAHEGQIWVKSQLGCGSEFIVELPVNIMSGTDPLYDEVAVAKEINIEKINIEFSDIYA